MKLNELRIGNYLQGKEREPQTVAYITDCIGLNNLCGGVDKYQNNPIISNDIKDLQPIPLTEDWLLKFSMAKAKNSYYFPNEMGFRVRRYKDNWVFYIFTDLFQYSLSEIKHVHQLQNLYFALTGKELTI